MGDSFYKEQMLAYISENFNLLFSKKKIAAYSLETNISFLRKQLNGQNIEPKELLIDKKDFDWGNVEIEFSINHYVKLFENASKLSDMEYVILMTKFF